MSKPTHNSANPIERLLQDRAQFVSWLTRLNSSSEAPAVPEAVRGRVRADYERRLEAVLHELKSHTNAIEEQVSGLSARRDQLSSREREYLEQLTEAEVRHMVGEYDETKWEGIRAEMMKVISQVREELGDTTTEIDRLTEVLSTIQAPVAPAVPEPVAPAPLPPLPPPVNVSAPRPVAPPQPAPPASRPPEPEPPVYVEPVRPAAAAPPPAPANTELPFRPVTPRPVAKPTPTPAPAPAPKKEDGSGRTLWFPSGKPAEPPPGKLDELAFLKSVTGGEAPPAAPPPAPPTPAPKRASGGFGKPADTPVMEPAASKASPPPAPEPKDRPSAANGQKTLKCAECGTLNRPTEWYCERCGAELAAL